MSRQTKILSESDPKVLDAERRGNEYLAKANETSNREQAEKLYTKGQYWMDRYNRMTGRA